MNRCLAMAGAEKIALAAILFLAMAIPAGFCSDIALLQSGSTMLSVKFMSADNTSLSGEKIVFSYGGTSVSTYTDAGGIASVNVDKGGEVLASVKKNDYNYSFAFQVAADGSPKSETAVLALLLKIEYFESAPDGPGCYKLSAKASDPRQNRPISIRMMQVKNDSTPAGEIRAAPDENGVYVGKVCTVPEMSVKVVASNLYETAEKTIALAQPAAPEPPVNVPQPPTAAAPPLLPKPAVEPSPVEGLGAIFVGIVILVLVFGASLLILGRASPKSAGGMAKYFSRTWGVLAGSAVRPIIEYLRSLIRKKEPPPIASFGR